MKTLHRLIFSGVAAIAYFLLTLLFIETNAASYFGSMFWSAVGVFSALNVAISFIYLKAHPVVNIVTACLIG